MSILQGSIKLTPTADHFQSCQCTLTSLYGCVLMPWHTKFKTNQLYMLTHFHWKSHVECHFSKYGGVNSAASQTEASSPESPPGASAVTPAGLGQSAAVQWPVPICPVLHGHSEASRGRCQAAARAGLSPSPSSSHGCGSRTSAARSPWCSHTAGSVCA